MRAGSVSVRPRPVGPGVGQLLSSSEPGSEQTQGPEAAVQKGPVGEQVLANTG